MKQMITFTLNGKQLTKEVTDHQRLLDFLRDDLDMTGTKEGCSVGECGACTVIFNGRAVNSCLMLAPQIDGGELITVEGLEKNGELDRLQQSFIDHGAVQCGYCTPGMLMSAYALLMKKSDPTTEEIKIALAGNLCRCTGYVQIVEAIEAVRD
jgi:carbon-monoxide dehydrogenase small subunit